LLFAAYSLDTAIRVKQEGLGNGVDDALRVLWKWDVDSGSTFDLPHLTEKHVQHDSVDRVICPIEKTGFDLRRLLAEAVNAPLTLFKAVGIPGKIIVKYTGKEFLKVDSFAQAVGSDKDARFVP
jgi:hypothetical protein